MRTIRNKTAIGLLMLGLLTGCAQLQQLVGTVLADQPLTATEIIAGLQPHLSIGADSAVGRISKTDGYYRDQLIRILLPPEADIITQNLSRIPGGDRLVEEVIRNINRSAEEAAGEALPIFVTAITGMTISDGLTILKGGETAAPA